MSRLRPAMSAPRRPTNADSTPATASQEATFAPEPPPCIVTVAGVSPPLDSGNAARATASVIKSPITTTRVIDVTTLFVAVAAPGGGICHEQGGNLTVLAA